MTDVYVVTHGKHDATEGGFFRPEAFTDHEG